MNKKEEALKELEEIRKRVGVLEEIINQEEVVTYPCEFPVEGFGQILFNDQKQLLTVNRRGFYVVESPVHIDKYEDYSDKFIWVPIKREDLKVGDTAYRTDREEDFTRVRRICKILDDKKYASIGSSSGGIIIMTNEYKYWYKLVEKE